MDEQTILSLAILSLGTFIGALLVTVYYFANVRPQLLDSGQNNSLQTALDEQRQIAHHLQQEWQNYTQQWSDYLGLMDTQHKTQQSITTDLLHLQQGQAQPLTVSTVPDEFRQLLSEHRAILDELQKILGENQRTLSNQSAVFSRHLKSNQLVLQRLALLMQNNPPPSLTSSPQLTELMRQIDELAKMVQTIGKQKAPATVLQQDRFSDIKGIGPVFSGILHEAGIHNFTQLAQMTSDELDNLLNLPKWRKVSTQEWIDQARIFATQRQKLEG